MAGQETVDPLWAVRWVKRAFKLALALAAVVVVLVIVWIALPVEPTQARLMIDTNTKVLADGEFVGTGVVTLEHEQLARIGKEFPAGSDPEVIARAFYPGHEFRGPIMVTAGDITRAGGLEYNLRAQDGDWLFVRVFCFELDDETWLAVPLRFEHDRGRSTNADDWIRHISWDVKWPPAKQRTEGKEAFIYGVEDDPPGDDEMTIGPITIE